MQLKRKQVLEFFKHPFPVFLVRVEDGRRARLSTVKRVVSDACGDTVGSVIDHVKGTNH